MSDPAADPFVEFDAAYVLGALSPDDRHAFQQHLRSCAACTARVNELADLPGLLARASPQADTAEPPPDLLLPRMLRAARTERRRRRWILGSGWVAAAACAVTLVLVLTLGSSTTGAPPTAAPATAMEPVGATPLTAQVSLTGVAWGTKIELKCTYPAGYATENSYYLVILDRNDRPQQVGSWKVLPGRTSTMAASTDIPAADISRVEIHALDGSTVMQLEP